MDGVQRRSFYVATDTDSTAARFDLTQLEQLRWVLSGLLEIRDLNATLAIPDFGHAFPSSERAILCARGYYVLVLPPEARVPLGQVGQLFLDANTPRLPAEVESGMAQLFETLKADGSRVSWGGMPATPDLAFARVQLFATKFDYRASFHIFLSSLRSGSTLRAAEHNAFGKDVAVMEEEAATRLAARDFQPVATTGKPLDPRRDFGEHPLDESLAGALKAAVRISTDIDAAETELKNLLGGSGPAKAFIWDALADVAVERKESPDEFLASAIKAGSKDARVYVRYAEDLSSEDALPLLKKAQELNPFWAEPIFQQGQATGDQNERESLLKQAAKMNPRSTEYLLELARVQMADGHSTEAQSTWLRAEDSAATEKQRILVQREHEVLEAARLNKAESERKDGREAMKAADRRAQQSEADRIRAAEERANAANAAESQSHPDTEVVDYGSLVKPQKTVGTVVMIECRALYTRVGVRDLRGRTRVLLYHGDDPQHKIFSCNGQPDPRQIVVTFKPHDDDAHGTDGEIVSITWR